MNLEYNSSRDNLIIPEYGRHVQKLIKYACTIEEKDKRQAYVAEIIEVMMKTNAEKDGNDSDEKLYKHAVRISNFELDITMPDGEPITKESVRIKPRKPEYPESIRKYRHYGRYAQELIKKAVEFEDGEKKEEFIQLIGSYMKLAYLNWNRDHFVNDDSVKSDLKALSKGKLTIDNNNDLDYLKSSNKKSHQKNKSSHNRKRRNSRRRRSRN